MNKFSITMISLVAMTGLVMAQQKPADPKTGTGTAAGAGATVKAGAGAQAGGTGGAAAGGTAKAGAGAATGAATGAAQAPAKVEMPKPPAEIKATLKAMGTRMTCTGSGLGMDMKTMVDFKGTGTSKATLDGWWIQGSMTGTMGKGKEAVKMKMENYMTWDAKAGKWRTVSLMNDGSMMVGTADFANGKWSSTADTYGGMMGSGKFRETGDMSDPKAGMKMTGEVSTDGKTWTKVYEMTCKK